MATIFSAAEKTGLDELSPRTPSPASSQVRWRDLVPLTRREKVVEVLHPLPWLLLSLYCYQSNHFLFAIIASFYFFLTGLRLSHGAQHYSLGLPRLAQDAILFSLSVLMLGSMHAVQASHLHHHRHCLAPSDAEGATARLPWWRALLIGPLFPIRLHRSAWALGNRRQRSWIAAELAAAVLLIYFAYANSAVVVALPLHAAAMLVGECFTGFFAVWTVHHHCDAEGLEESHNTHARTQRGRWINFLSYNMFFHAEHHLYPAVPTPHLAMLAERLDGQNPNVHQKQVISFQGPHHRSVPTNDRKPAEIFHGANI